MTDLPKVSELTENLLSTEQKSAIERHNAEHAGEQDAHINAMQNSREEKRQRREEAAVQLIPDNSKPPSGE